MRFQSRLDGEYVKCRSCDMAGYGLDAWLPATSEFWVTHLGVLQFSKCKACRSEVAARRFGFVPAKEAA
jgi:hypothetical protein